MMTFAQHFEQALTITPALPAGHSAQLYIGTFYELLEQTAHRLPTVLCGGSVEIASNDTLTFKPMDCHMLLYTKEGSGRLRLHAGSAHRMYPLAEGALLYSDCRTSSFTLEPVNVPWRFTLFLVQGELFSDYNALVPFETAIVHPLSAYSSIKRDMELLLAGGTNATLYNKLADANLLTDIMTKLWIESYDLKRNDERCAAYLLEIRHYLDTSFAEPFRLDDFEIRYHMSKYKICREFSNTFGIPPLKYLNRKRLENAVNLLFSTDMRIHEIALEVGYENTNHFINLFKKEYGTTPQAYREAHHC